jgi:hypothetical protein
VIVWNCNGVPCCFIWPSLSLSTYLLWSSCGLGLPQLWSFMAFFSMYMDWDWALLFMIVVMLTEELFGICNGVSYCFIWPSLFQFSLSTYLHRSSCGLGLQQFWSFKAFISMYLDWDSALWFRIVIMPTEGLSIEQPDSQHSVDQDEEVGLLSVTRQVRFSQAINPTLIGAPCTCLFVERV